MRKSWEAFKWSAVEPTVRGQAAGSLHPCQQAQPPPRASCNNTAVSGHKTVTIYDNARLTVQPHESLFKSMPMHDPQHLVRAWLLPKCWPTDKTCEDGCPDRIVVGVAATCEQSAAHSTDIHHLKTNQQLISTAGWRQLGTLWQPSVQPNSCCSGGADCCCGVTCCCGYDQQERQLLLHK